MSKVDYLCAKLKVMDANGRTILCKPLKQLPLAEQYYSIEGEKRIGSKEPCILERKFIENSLCVENAQKIQNGRKYGRNEIEWLFQMYALDGEYAVIDY